MSSKSSSVYVVLLVDVDAAQHTLVQSALPESCAFLGARTGAAALRLISRREPSLAILDASVDPSLDSLVAALKERAPQVRFIVLTPSKNPGNTSKLAAIGPVVTKPIDAARFRDTVANALRLCKMSETIAHLRSESINVQTFSTLGTTTRDGGR